MKATLFVLLATACVFVLAKPQIQAQDVDLDLGIIDIEFGQDDEQAADEPAKDEQAVDEPAKDEQAVDDPAKDEQAVDEPAKEEESEVEDEELIDRTQPHCTGPYGTIEYHPHPTCCNRFYQCANGVNGIKPKEMCCEQDLQYGFILQWDQHLEVCNWPYEIFGFGVQCGQGKRWCPCEDPDNDGDIDYHP